MEKLTLSEDHVYMIVRFPLIAVLHDLTFVRLVPHRFNTESRGLIVAQLGRHHTHPSLTMHPYLAPAASSFQQSNTVI